MRRDIPEDVGKFSKKVDAALPGKHTRRLYDDLSREEASVLAQLRTGIARLMDTSIISKQHHHSNVHAGKR